MLKFSRVIVASSALLLALQTAPALSESAKKKTVTAKSAVKTLQNGNTTGDNSLNPQGVDPSSNLVVTPKNGSTITGVGDPGGDQSKGTGGTDTTGQAGTGNTGGSTGGGSGGTNPSGQSGSGTSGGTSGGGSGGSGGITPEPQPSPS